MPDRFGHRTQVKEQEDMDRQSQVKAGRKNPLHIETQFNFDLDDERVASNERKVEKVDCACGKVNVKSGKYAKSNINLIKQEIWPHTAVSKKYMKHTAFESLDFEGFVAGESKIIHAMLVRDSNCNRAIGRLRVLTPDGTLAR